MEPVVKVAYILMFIYMILIPYWIYHEYKLRKTIRENLNKRD